MNSSELNELLKRLEMKIDFLIEENKKKELLSGWIEEKDVIAITNPILTVGYFQTQNP